MRAALRSASLRSSSPTFSMTAAIETIGGLVPPLVSVAARQRLRRVVGVVPAAVSNRLYFECRLTGDEQVDVVLCADEHNRAALAGGRAIAPAARDHPVWRGVVRLFERWQRTPPPCFTQVWLELDATAEAEASGAPLPGVFLAFPADASRRAIAATTVREFRLLRDAPFEAPTTRAIVQAIRRLPASARLEYVGLMCSRTLDAVRFCIGNLRRHELLAYLREIEWPGAIDDLQAAIAPLACESVRDPLATVALLHVDVSDRVGPRLGMEVCFSRRHQLVGVTRERDFLDRLCALGLATPAKCEALLAWPGSTMAQFDHELAPSLVVRRLNAIKLVVVPGRPLEAKVYLTAFHAVRRRVTAYGAQP